jgi:hypothetical protein
MKIYNSKNKSWVLDRIENGSLVLTCQDEQIIIPKSMAPDGVKEGDVLTAEFYHLKDETKRRENIARALLEEILGS